MVNEKNWKKLRSGSDVRGVAMEGVEGEPVTLTVDDVGRICSAFADWLSQRCGKEKKDITISVGRDCRLSSGQLAVGALYGLLLSGLSVVDCGPCTTPAMFMTTRPEELDCDGAIMVTASHLPWNRNGLKFFTREGGLQAEDIEDILADCKNPVEREPVGELRQTPYMKRYAELLRERIRRELGGMKPLEGLKIPVDAGNGMGGFYARQVLEPLGADVSGSQFLDQDGRFPNHIPNPEEEEAALAAEQMVKRCHADLGVMLDTDCDRAAVVGQDGSVFNRNKLIALVAAIVMQKEKEPIIVTDSLTSEELSEFVEKRGGIHRRFKRGYNNVIGEAQRLQAPMGIETSGHCAFAENFYLDDGSYLALKIIVEMARLKRQGKTLFTLLEGYRDPVEEASIRLRIREADFVAYGMKVLNEVEIDAWKKKFGELERDNEEGVRVNFPEGQGYGWLLLRMSLHDPVMPINIESKETGGAKKMAQELYKILQKQEALDLTPLEEYIKG